MVQITAVGSGNLVEKDGMEISSASDRALMRQALPMGLGVQVFLFLKSSVKM